MGFSDLPGGVAFSVSQTLEFKMAGRYFVKLDDVLVGSFDADDASEAIRLARCGNDTHPKKQEAIAWTDEDFKAAEDAEKRSKKKKKAEGEGSES